MKYQWHSRKYWLTWIKQDVLRFYYSTFHGIEFDGLGKSVLPTNGKTKWVSVKSKGKYIDIDCLAEFYTNEVKAGDRVRIIPCLYNHGIFVELYKGGKLRSRHVVSIDQFFKDIIYASNVEQLAGRKKLKHEIHTTDQAGVPESTAGDSPEVSTDGR